MPPSQGKTKIDPITAVQDSIGENCPIGPDPIFILTVCMDGVPDARLLESSSSFASFDITINLIN